MAPTLIRPLLAGVVMLATSCLIEHDVLLPFATMVPRPLDDDWPTMPPKEAGFDEDALRRVFQDLHRSEMWQLRSLLVFRRGHLVAETYFKDEDDLVTPRAIWSCTKQFTGVLVGMAIEAGLVDGVDAPLASCIGEVEDHPDKLEITIEDLLQMRSGIDWDNDGVQGQTNEVLRRIPPDSVDFTLSLPMHAEPGATSHYNDGDPHLLSVCVQRQAGRPLDAWADEVLFEPLGLRNYAWRRYRDGTTLGGFGMLTTPREMAKLGQLVLQRGAWNDTQLVRESWIDTMTSPLVDAYDDRYRFGYQWWFHVEHGWSFMNGHGGQYVFIDRDTETLVVMTAEPNTQDDFQISVEEAAPTVLRILDAIVED